MTSIHNTSGFNETTKIEQQIAESGKQIKKNSQIIATLERNVLANQQINTELSNRISILDERSWEIQKNIEQERSEIKRLSVTLKNQQHSEKRCLTLLVISLILVIVGVAIIVLRLRLFKN